MVVKLEMGNQGVFMIAGEGGRDVLNPWNEIKCTAHGLLPSFDIYRWLMLSGAARTTSVAQITSRVFRKRMLRLIWQPRY